MRDAVSLYTFQDRPMPELVEEFAGYGFEVFSFNREMLIERDANEVRETARLIRRKGRGATVHSNFDLTPDMLARLLELFGDHLCRLTFDAAHTQTSVGTFYDMKKMGRVLADVARQADGAALMFGVEDFPLDAAALEHYRRDLAPFVDNPAFGTLIDLGHLNLRLRSVDHFQGMSPEQYITGVPVPIIEIHVHDNLGNRDSHAPIGCGNADFEAMAQGLRASGFDGISTIEICPVFYDSTPADARPQVRDSLSRWRAVWAASAG